MRGAFILAAAASVTALVIPSQRGARPLEVNAVGPNLGGILHELHDARSDAGRPSKQNGQPAEDASVTIYQQLSALAETTELRYVLDSFLDLVAALDDTSKHFTVFAPSNDAWRELGSAADGPGTARAKNLLRYHIAPQLAGVGESRRSLPTLLLSPMLNGPQVLQLSKASDGASKLQIAQADRLPAITSTRTIQCANGVIHLIPSVLSPPKHSITSLLQDEASDLRLFALGMTTTGLMDDLTQGSDVDFAALGGHIGSTVFAPTDAAFAQLGAPLNDFLFTTAAGRPYLRALLESHLVLNHTLYSSLLYAHDAPTALAPAALAPQHPLAAPRHGTPHYALPSMLRGHALDVSVSAATLTLHPAADIHTPDRLATDGVLHVVDRVLVPAPRGRAGSAGSGGSGALSVEDFTARLRAYMG